MTVEKVLCSRTQVVSPGVLNWPGSDRRVVLLRGLCRNLGGPTRASRGATWVVPPLVGDHLSRGDPVVPARISAVVQTARLTLRLLEG
jgi:hypothetical protein